ncbi:MAG: cell wall-active antibiotics response protein [Spirochaetales bacterium]|nr:cell wall-active antibiotics response protein [Spirochaetales bacterium]
MKEESLPESAGYTVYGLPKLRSRVESVLGDAYTQNEIEMDELERRLALVQEAASVEALRRVVYDFPPDTVSFLYPADARSRSGTVERTSQSGSTKHINLIGDKSIAGIDIGAPINTVISVLGDVRVDLTDVVHRFNRIRIVHFGVLGDITVRVPANASVSRRIGVLLGDSQTKRRKKKRRDHAAPHAPHDTAQPPLEVELVGFNLIGDCTILYEPDA